jgi:hypothetical protein
MQQDSRCVKLNHSHVHDEVEVWVDSEVEVVSVVTESSNLVKNVMLLEERAGVVIHVR